MTTVDIAPFFRLVDPPAQDAYGPFDSVTWAEGVIAKIDFPWDLCKGYFERRGYEGGKVKVVWENIEDGLLGQWHQSSGTIRLHLDKWRRHPKDLTTEISLTLAHEIGHMVDSAVLTNTNRDRLLEAMHPVPYWPCPYPDQWSMPSSKTTWFDRHNEAYGDFFVEAFAPAIWNSREARTFHHRGPLTPEDTRRITLDVAPPPSTWEPKDSIFRLYRAYFLRDPDRGGYDHWKAKLDSGWTLVQISDGFAQSTEFRNTYGALSDADFVRLVYRNVLGREADPGGFEHWMNHLRSGKSRGYVMVGFSESTEFKNKTGS